MLTLHHLGISQSERIVWLLEELELDYELVVHERAPSLSPESLRSVPGNETGRAPFLVDSTAGLTLGESGAICEYIINRYGRGRFSLPVQDANYPQYLYWLHYANSTIQANIVCSMFMEIAKLPGDNPVLASTGRRLHAVFEHLDERLKDNKWLVGEVFTAADIMSVYCLTTQRYFGPLVSLKEYPHILRWLKECSDRPAYQRAMRKSDPEMAPLLGAEAPSASILTTGGVKSTLWRRTQ